jgi:hypothetical protein
LATARAVRHASNSQKKGKLHRQVIKDETGTFEYVTDQDGDMVSLKRLDDKKEEKDA